MNAYADSFSLWDAAYVLGALSPRRGGNSKNIWRAAARCQADRWRSSLASQACSVRYRPRTRRCSPPKRSQAEGEAAPATLIVPRRIGATHSAPADRPGCRRRGGCGPDPHRGWCPYRLAAARRARFTYAARLLAGAADAQSPPSSRSCRRMTGLTSGWNASTAKPTSPHPAGRTRRTRSGSLTGWAPRSKRKPGPPVRTV